jgi:ubiquinone/menaquinone biosynthesis C-methylase UbiE
MDRPMSNLHFRLMSLEFKLRDFFSAREGVLNEVGIRPGSCVLDYGCGSGSYVTPAANLVGESGKVYALDIHPLAVQSVQNLASKKRLANVETIRSHCETGLPHRSVDVVLLYDTLHALADPTSVLQELHRVLKPDGILSVSDHHMKDDELARNVTNAGLFRLSAKGEKTHTFLREDQ